MKTAPQRRVIGLQGCLNFRDLGGYPTSDGQRVRWRCVFRSDALHLLTGADVLCLRDELNVGTVIDLRSTAELRAEGRGRLSEEAVCFLHAPLYDGEIVKAERQAPSAGLADRYFLLAGFAGDRIARVLTTIADAERSVVYHCAAGKDRTGVISAILLGLLGVREDIIVADYAASGENLDAIIERLMASEGYQNMLEALPADTLHAEPGTMVGFLAKIGKEYGSMHAYARAVGVSDATVEKLRERLLDKGRDGVAR